MTAHAYLDKFSVMGRCIYLEGWATDLALELTYAGEPVVLSVVMVDRPDLSTVFGEGARNWGFAAAGLLNVDVPDRSRFSLKFNNEIEKVNPQDSFSASEDVSFTAMISKFQSEVAGASGASLLEIGSRARSGNSYRSWFPSVNDYVGIDVTPGENVDLVCDAHHMAFQLSRKFRFVFSIAVFEHILMPWKVALEMNKVMELGGSALIISHASWPLHEEPWDFFRFSKEAWGGLFNAHTGFEMIDSQYQHPASIVPDYIHNDHFLQMSRGPTFLLSACVVRKTGDAKVVWDAEVGEVYDLHYSHV